MNEKKEKNAYQKYDDLFVEQDKEYDRNNRDRYTKKKDSSRVDRFEVQPSNREEPNRHQTNKQKYSLVSGIFSLIIFGGIINFLFVGSSTYSMWASPIIIFVIVMIVISKAIKNK